ncbi:MAG: DM13 domain-containing protein [Pseudonocardiales bacterium]
MRSRHVLVPVCLLAAGLLTAALAWFQPWKLWVDDRVNDRLPPLALVPTTPSDAASSAPLPSATAAPPVGPSPSKPSGAVLLSRGQLISHEHPTHGTVSVIRASDGSRVLAIAHLDTSNGPDLHVWLTDAPVRPGSGGYHVFDDGEHVSLGVLKGNKGDQVYSIPTDLDLSRLTSVAIWCDRFDVSFGAAELVPAAN